MITWGATGVAADLRQRGRRGGDASLADTVEVLTAKGQSVGRMVQVVADSTNRLALNATIEAVLNKYSGGPELVIACV